VLKRIVVQATTLALALLVGVALTVSSAHATAGKKVDCDQVMSELNGGKKAKEVAKDLSISTSSVYRCRKKSQKPAAAASTGATTASKAASSPAAAPSPAAH
jgi:hypothetical protein